MRKVLLSIFLIGLVGLGAMILVRRGQNNLRVLRTQYEAEIERLTTANRQQTEDDLAKHRSRMSDSELISGNRARQAHDQEWNKRCEYDPAFARTTREKTILEISTLAEDKSLSDQELLQRVAVLAAPRKSTVDVTPVADGFRLVVTFDMSVMSSGEEGSRTKHLSIESLKREVIEIISRVSKDMHDHCGHKGIDSIAIACTHGVQQSQSYSLGNFTLPETLGPGFASDRIRKQWRSSQGVFAPSSDHSTVTKTIYKCAITGLDAKKIPDWRRVPLHKVADMLRVEHDEFPYLRIVTTTIPGFGW